MADDKNLEDELSGQEGPQKPVRFNVYLPTKAYRRIEIAARELSKSMEETLQLLLELYDRGDISTDKKDKYGLFNDLPWEEPPPKVDY